MICCGLGVVVMVRRVGVYVVRVRTVSSGAVCASTHDGGVAWLDLEVIAAANARGELCEQFFGDVDDRAALVADQMDVAACFQLIEGGTRPGMDMFDDAEFIEAAENAVDGRRSDTGYSPIRFGDDVVGSWVAISIEHDRYDDSHRHCQATACLANGVVDRFLSGFGDLRVDHVTTVPAAGCRPAGWLGGWERLARSRCGNGRRCFALGSWGRSAVESFGAGVGVRNGEEQEVD